MLCFDFLNHPIRIIEHRSGARSPGHRHDPHSCGASRVHTGDRVLDSEALRRLPVQPAGCREVYVRIRLAAVDLIPRNCDLEAVGETGHLQAMASSSHRGRLDPDGSMTPLPEALVRQRGS